MTNEKTFIIIGDIHEFYDHIPDDFEIIELTQEEIQESMKELDLLMIHSKDGHKIWLEDGSGIVITKTLRILKKLEGL